MPAEESGGDPPGELARVQARAGIRGWVTRSAATLRHMTPGAILTGMAAAAFAPILAPLVTSADPAAAQAALLAEFGGAGAAYLVAIVQQFAGRLGDRPETPAITEEKLRDLLRATFEEGLSGARSAQTRSAINDLVLDVRGVEALLQAASENDDAGLLSHLVRALSQERSFQAVMLSKVDSLLSAFTRLQSGQRDDYELRSRELFELRLLRRELTRLLPAVEEGEVAPVAGASPADGPCPYPGLAPFGERDADWFFGRDALVAELVNALNERIYGSTPLVFAGVSGAGKSSVLRAGLIPELRAGGLAEPGSADWPVRAMRPDSNPLEQLSLRLGELAGLMSPDVRDQLGTDPARASMIVRQGLLSQEERHSSGIVLAGTDPVSGVSGGPGSAQRRLILIIDQFEEVFTRCRDGEERQVFIDALCAIASGSRDEPPAGLVVIGLQIAFMEQCTAHPDLRPAINGPVTVDPMTAGELRDAIELPARRAHLTVQPGLVPAMLGDIGAVGSRDTGGLRPYDPGRLPLLAHALLETWKARDGRELTIAAYQKAGRVQDALATTADSLLESLDESERQTLRRLLVYHLVAAGDFTEDARRHIGREALLDELPAQDRKSAGELLDRLAAARLLSEDKSGVQIAHEALLRHWPTLANWLEEERDWRREAQRVAEQARQWSAAGKDANLLPRGIALAIAEDKIASAQAGGLSGLGELGEEFVRAARRQRAQARVRRRFSIAGAAAAIAMTAVLLVTFLQFRAIDSRNLAIAQSRAETSQLIESANQSANDPVLSLLLNVEAYRVGGVAADNGLLSAQADFFTSTLPDPAGAGSAVAFDATAPLLAVAGQHAVTVFRVTDHQLAHTLRGRSPFYAAAFSPSGTLLAGAEQDGTTIIWDVKTWKPAAVLGAANGLSVNAVAFQPGGNLIATAGISGVVTLWDLHGHRISTFVAGTRQNVVTINAIAFSPDGTRLAAACSDRTVRLWNVRGKPGLRKLTGHSGPVRAVAFSPGSAVLASADDDGAIRLWNVRTGSRLGSLPGSGTQPVDALAFSPHGTLLASGGGDEAVRLWDIDTRTQIRALTGPSSRVTGLAFSPNGQTIASVEADHTVGFWNVITPPQPGTSSVAAVATAASGHEQPIATIGSSTAIGLWNPSSDASYASAPLAAPLAVSAADPGDIPPSLALSPDGHVLAAPLGNHKIGLWSTASGHKNGLLTTPQPITSVAYSPAAGAPILAAGGSDGSVYLWPPGAHRPTSINGELATQITSIAFSPDGALLAAGSADGTFLLVRRSPDGQWSPITPPTLPLDAINTVAFSADGSLLATGSASGTVRLWNISNPHNPVKTASLTGPAGQVVSVAFSHDGMLAVSSDDDSIRVWNTRNPAAPTLVATLTGLASPTSVAWEPRTQTLAGAAPDGTLLTWDTNPGDVANRICRSLAGDARQVAALVPSTSYPPVCPLT